MNLIAVNSFVLGEKTSRQTCMFLEPKHLNKVIKRDHHPIMRVDNITPVSMVSHNSLS